MELLHEPVRHILLDQTHGRLRIRVGRFPIAFVLDEEGLACIIETEFEALEDWPDFMVGPMEKGDKVFIESFIFYTIGPDGKFTHIRTTRSKG